MIKRITPTTISTVKIPKPIPALKIPSIAAQEVNKKDKAKKKREKERIDVFIEVKVQLVPNNNRYIIN